MKRSIIAGLLVLVAFARPGPARAADLEAVRRDVLDALAFIANAGVIGHGPVEVRPEADGSFVVEVRDLRYTPGAMRAELGTLALRLAAPDAEHYEIRELQLPASFAVVGPEGTRSTVVLGSQSFTGTFSKRSMTWTAVDAAYGDVSVTAPSGAPSAALGALRMRASSTEDAAEETEVAVEYGADRLSIVTPAGRFDLGDAELKGTAKGDPARMISLATTFSADLQRLAELQQRVAPAQPTPEQLQPLLPFFRQLLAAYPAISAEVRVHGLAWSETDGTPVWSMTEAGYPLEIIYAPDGTTTISTGFDFSGLTVQAALPALTPGTSAAFMPRSLALHVTVERIPATQLLDILFAPFLERWPTPEEMTQVQAMLGPAVIRLLSEAGTKVKLSRSHLELGDTRIEFEGVQHVDETAAVKTTGDYLVEIRGLDKLIDAVAKEPMFSGGLSPVLAILLAMSDRQLGADGAPVDRYHWVLLPTGRVMLNGKEFSTSLAPRPN